MKSTNEKMQIQVGAFVVVGLILAMLVIFLLGSEKRLFETQYTLTAHFSDISGLRSGAPVQLAGINVGTVNKIEFDESLNSKKVKLTLRITKSFQDRIRDDSMATIATQGLLGDKMVTVSVGSPERPVLENDAEIKSASQSGFSQIMEQSGDVLTEVEKLAENINAILSEVRTGEGVLHQLVYNPKGEAIFDDVGDMAANFEGISQNAKSITLKIDQGQGTLGALVNDPTLFYDIKTLLGKANRNKLIRAVIRETLRTKEEEGLKKE